MDYLSPIPAKQKKKRIKLGSNIPVEPNVLQVWRAIERQMSSIQEIYEVGGYSNQRHRKFHKVIAKKPLSLNHLDKSSKLNPPKSSRIRGGKSRAW